MADRHKKVNSKFKKRMFGIASKAMKVLFRVPSKSSWLKLVSLIL